MKRVLCFVLILSLVILSGCSRERKYRFLQDIKEIKKIEIVEVPYDNNETARAVRTEILNCNFDSVVFYSTVEGHDISEFLDKFTSMSCRSAFLDPSDNIFGHSFLITFNDNSWQLVNCYSGLSYDTNKSKFYYPTYYFQQDEFDSLWERYAQVE